MSGEKERKKIFWDVKKRKKDNRALNIIKKGWKKIKEKIKRMVDEIEKKIIKLKAEQKKEKEKQKKSPEVCLVCINQGKKTEKEKRIVKR